MPTERLTFTGGAGALLSARLELPVGSGPRAYALFAHCFTCSKNLKAAVAVSRALTSAGFGVVRFDFTGLGESEGDFADTNFSSNVDDLRAAIAFMREELEGPALLVGHSLGGAAVLRVAGECPTVKAVVTIGAPAEAKHVLQHLRASSGEIAATGEAEVSIGGRPFKIKKQFVDDLAMTSMRDAVANLGRALLIMHAPTDQIVGIHNAAQIYGWAKHPKSFVSLDDADHLLSNAADSEYAAGVIGAWASRYVPALAVSAETPAGPDGGSGASDLAETDRVVVRTGAEGFYTDVAASGHVLVADEPASVGGTEKGPTPYDYVLAGLGACTSMTLRMYADRKEWPLEEVVVRLRHAKRHGPDAKACRDDDSCRLDRVDRDLELTGDLTNGQRERLLEIAERCPVHRTLDAGVETVTRLV